MGLSNQVVDDLARDTGQAEIQSRLAVSEFLVIETQHRQHRGVQIVHMHSIHFCPKTKLIRCAVHTPSLGPASGHPLTLSAPTPGLGGTWNEVAVRGGTPGATVHLVYGRFSGATPIPSCPDELLIRKASVVAHAVVNDMGVATISAFVPARVSGTRVLLQAVQADACDRSDLIVHDFP